MDSKGPNGPVEVEIKVQIIREDGSQRGVATIGMGYGTYPTPAQIQQRVAKFEQEELTRLAPGFRLQTAPELWDTACEEKTGQSFATPAKYHAYHPID